MTHVDDWLDDPQTGPADVKAWLEHFRRPAAEQDYDWLASKKLLCVYKGMQYRCTGCSRMGDVWLSRDLTGLWGYDLRVDIDDCTRWEMVSTV